MDTVKDFITELTTAGVCGAVNVGPKAVSRAAVNNKFPSSWKYELNLYAEEKGVEIPDDLYSWRKGRTLRPSQTSEPAE